MSHFNSKVLLFGEYSILYDSMALVMPLDRFSGELTFSTSEEDQSSAIRSNEYLKKFCAFVASHMDEHFVLEVKRFEQELDRGLFFKSNIPIGYGLGSSGALVAAIFLRYLKKAKDVKDELKQITFDTSKKLKFSLAQMESYFHGSSSGIDPLSIVLNQPVLIKSQEDISPVTIPVQNENGKNVIFLVDTGVPRNTANMMAEFKRLCSNSDFKSKVDNEMVTFTNNSINSFLNNNTTEFYKDLDKLVHFQLDEMKYFIPVPFQKTVADGLDNGSYFLKVCGAGGGGFMLGFTEDWHATSEQLKDLIVEPIYRF
ncbi:MAG TPA: hypothetical protein VLZ83_00375 [Edaphocola sp.]|nr:hypothetical protein [Edaphocola sp.]